MHVWVQYFGSAAGRVHMYLVQVAVLWLYSGPGAHVPGARVGHQLCRVLQ